MTEPMNGGWTPSGRPSQDRFRSAAYLTVMVGVLGGAVLAWIRPDLIAARFTGGEGIPAESWAQGASAVIRSLVLPLLCGVGLLALYWRRLSERNPPAFFRLVSVLTLVAYWGLASVLSDWIVDDAAITFAYAENLVAGHGLVLHPSLEPEEAYSNTLWLLILAAVRWMGVPIPVAAKSLNIAIASLSIVLTLGLSRRLVGDRCFSCVSPLLIALLLQAPFIVWSISGLEHALQGLLFLGVVAACTRWGPQRRWWVAALLSLLVLVRPETPLIVGCVWLMVSVSLHLSNDGEPWWSAWPIVVIPALSTIALLGFRLAYFGDPMPNPYYAKAGEATFLRLLNIGRGGWGYVFGWLSQVGVLVVVPFLFMAPVRRAPLSLRVVLAIVIGHLGFIIFAGGDWMACYRFIAPIVPLVALVAASGFDEALGKVDRSRAFFVSCALALVLSTLSLTTLAQFRSRPTTPMSVVAAVGHSFADLADRLEIDDPVLAHHDAGGTSYKSVIAVIDLGGLGDRRIARHMGDRDFLVNYLLVERRPTFIFGGLTVFAAKTRFYEDPLFDESYVRVVFERFPYVFPRIREGERAILSHVRRDLVRDLPGVELARSDTGEITEVRVKADR